MGRPIGSRNKLNATDEIKKALSRGTGLLELKSYLWDMMNNKDVSELQKAKFTQMYLDIMKYIHTENLKIESESQSTKSSASTESEEKPSVEQSGNISKISFGKK